MANERDIQIGALRIFAVVAESETLTSAAAKLNVTQSAVSQAIAQLETLTGIELLVRRSRPIKLTPAGEVLRNHANEILAHARRMLADVSRAADGSLPRLNIGVIDSFADVAGQHLTEMIAPIAPHLSLQTGLTMPLSDALLNHDIDILISSDPFSDHPEFECHPLLRDPFVGVISKSLCTGRLKAVDEFANNIPFARYSPRTRLGAMTDLVLRRAAIDVVARFEFDNTHALMRAVRAGQAWAIATSLCVMQYPDLLEDVEIMPVADDASCRYICLLARRGELGGTPASIADICRSIHSQHILPRMLAVMPWLKGQADSVTEVPQIWSA